MSDAWESPEMLSWAETVREKLVPAMADSAYVATLAPKDLSKIDVQFAVEIGISVLLDKPLIACVEPGVAVPPKLALIADRVIEADYRSGDVSDLARRIRGAIDELDAEARDAAAEEYLANPPAPSGDGS